ncbi:Rne/Rng family ribonuclease [Beggiatoa leptomitoformis]|uniref:Ribonuclease G n=1 Tax=Beggiatoa leptomitoformis TaxID=288004 RepID=A0A2N9YDB4_9GAMM|nr:Rne/Rng family ribonuclease [Beggiatoa leptomitoformis]ALG69116.1 Rne/Rng family ribonuclease [Beggiatoa leptomitoformis]AUI68470.1 Rne/Rng family ribonuclease [Beggiatoa leptomitoformis]
MSEEILINVTPRETRVAMVENGMLQEVVIERTRKRGIVSNIYKGRVCRVLPGMQAAFVDIGLERAAFLHASDILHPPIAGDSKEERKIGELIYEGQTLLVQVIKDPLGTKGARLTTQISIPSRYVVLIPHSANTIGVSTRIEKEDERKRLKELVLRYMGMVEQGVIDNQNDRETFATRPAENTTGSNVNPCLNYGFIIRTAAEGVSEEMLCADMDFLCRLWQEILEKSSASKPCSRVYEDFSLVIRTIRDLMGSSIEKVRIDSRETYREVVSFAEKFIPNIVPHTEHYPGERPIFDLYNIEDEINRALARKVLLKSGGYLVIDQTEAMTTIDVNTGAFVGTRNLEETIFKTNLEAAQAIARQLRLRNLGGIIILDFIDMIDAEHKRQVLKTLEKCLEKDHTKSHIIASEVSSLGLVQMTRKRTRESLEHVLCETCPTCQGRSSVKTSETVCYEIFREILRESRQFENQEFLVIASQDVVDMMIDEESNSVAELESFIQRSIRFQVETSYTQEQFDIVLLR